MNICIVGKYPPIEGGVSTSTYWIAYGLAQRGHSVHIVTNAREVEGEFRMHLTDDDAHWYQPKFPDSGGSVVVHSTEPFSRSALDHIPLSNPFVSKVAALTADVVRAHRCEVIIAYYYEPYAVGAWLASRWTHRPLALKHAGSDLDRLYRSAALATTYHEILRSADAVLTRPALMPRFLAMGIDSARLVVDPGFFLPDQVFNPQVEPLDLAGTALANKLGCQAAPCLGGHPTIGIYGKIGNAKGTFDLVAAAGRLAAEGIDFNLAAMIGEAQGRRLIGAMNDVKAPGRTYVLPFLPNWRVPSFIRACDAVCFLERDFPVVIHGPIIPREVLACATCLILSAEIANKQPYRSSLAHRENVILIQDPRDHEELAAGLKFVVTEQEQVVAIGQSGRLISAQIENFPEFAQSWDALTVKLASRQSVRSVEVPKTVDLIAPPLISFLRQHDTALLNDALAASGATEPIDGALRFCDVITNRVPDRCSDTEISKLMAVIRYQKARLLAHYGQEDHWVPCFAVSDQVQRRPLTFEVIENLRPVRNNRMFIEDFEWDVSAVFFGSLEGKELLEALKKDSSSVLFCRAPSYGCHELQINDLTRELVELSDGTRTTTQVVSHICEHLGLMPRDELLPLFTNAFEALYKADVLVFGKLDDKWGWFDGLQGSSVAPVRRISFRNEVKKELLRTATVI